jgi:hypothetical protein
MRPRGQSPHEGIHDFRRDRETWAGTLALLPHNSPLPVTMQHEASSDAEKMLVSCSWTSSFYNYEPKKLRFFVSPQSFIIATENRTRQSPMIFSLSHLLVKPSYAAMFCFPFELWSNSIHDFRERLCHAYCWSTICHHILCDIHNRHTGVHLLYIYSLI